MDYVANIAGCFVCHYFRSTWSAVNKMKTVLELLELAGVTLMVFAVVIGWALLAAVGCKAVLS